MTTAEYIKNSLKDFETKSQKINLFDSNLSSHSSRVFNIKDQNGNRYKVYDFADRILIETKANVSLHFAINLPDNVCLANKPLANTMDCKIFIHHSQDAIVLHCLELINDSILSLKLKSNEGVFVYRNSIKLAIDISRPLVEEVQNLQRIKDVIQSKFTDISEEIDVSKIPLNLQDIIPLLPEWAISDDDERKEKINRSSKAKLKKIIETVSPKMDFINNYLDSFKSEPLNYEATLIGNLAELISELSLAKD